MITNFALSLSFDGIRLLQRVADGWHLVSETTFDVPDLPAALAGMRKDALALDPSGLRTKILIPPEQIKYVTLDTAQSSLDDVMGALEGATPYDTKDLVVDFDRNGGRTFIAAVARETLQEAEQFAADHDFAPVCFAAIPEDMTFAGEVFFGPSNMAKTVTPDPVVRDDAAVRVIGTATLPKDAPKAAAPEKPAPAMPPADAPAAPPVKADASAKAPAVKAPAVPAPAVPAPDVQASKDKAPQVQAPTIDAGFTTTRKTAAVAAPANPSAPQSAPTPAPTPDPKPEPVPAPPPPSAKKRTTKAAAITTKQAGTKRGKPRFLGLILTAILLLFMAIVAIWASTLSEEDVAGWFGFGTGGIVESTQRTAPVVAAVPIIDPVLEPDIAAAPDAATDLVADAPVADPTPALPQIRETALGRVLTPAEAARLYAATGVWQRAPRVAVKPRTDDFAATIPASLPANTAITLPVMPDVGLQSPDLALIAPLDPPAFGTDFDRDADGFIRATPQGTLTPQGAFVIAGAPSKRPPARPQITPEVTNEAIDTAPAPDGVIYVTGRPSKIPPLRTAPAVLPAPQTDDVALTPSGNVALAGKRPNLRPDGLVPARPTAAPDPALAAERPKLRPNGWAAKAAPPPAPAPEPASPDISSVVAAIAEAAPPSPFVNPTARAVGTSVRPDPRPRNFDRLVARARDQAARQAAQQAARATAAKPVSNQTVRPTGNVPNSVANAATIDNAIRLRNVNLIGVYGRSSDRRALVRLGNGRYVKVEIGSSLDGGRVTAIGDSALNYVKRGKTIALQLPSG